MRYLDPSIPSPRARVVRPDLISRSTTPHDSTSVSSRQLPSIVNRTGPPENINLPTQPPDPFFSLTTGTQPQSSLPTYLFLPVAWPTKAQSACGALTTNTAATTTTTAFTKRPDDVPGFASFRQFRSVLRLGSIRLGSMVWSTVWF